MERRSDDEHRYRYCCGCFHVERGAYVLAAICVVFGALSAFGALVQGQAPNALSALLNTLLYVGIILAQHRRQPTLYLPYLIVAAIGTVILAVMACVLFTIGVFAPYAWDKYAAAFDAQRLDDKADDYAAARAALLIIAMAVAIGAAINAWLWRMVYLAYEFMKLQMSETNACPPKYSIV